MYVSSQNNTLDPHEVAAGLRKIAPLYHKDGNASSAAMSLQKKSVLLVLECSIQSSTPRQEPVRLYSS